MELSNKTFTIYIDKPNQAMPIYINDISDAIKVNANDPRALREIYNKLGDLMEQIRYHEFRCAYPNLSRKPNNMEKSFEEFHEARKLEEDL